MTRNKKTGRGVENGRLAYRARHGDQEAKAELKKRRKPDEYATPPNALQRGSLPDNYTPPDTGTGPDYNTHTGPA